MKHGSMSSMCMKAIFSSSFVSGAIDCSVCHRNTMPHTPPIPPPNHPPPPRTYIKRTIHRSDPAEGEELVKVAVLHAGVNHYGNIVVLHANVQHRVHVGMIQPMQESTAPQEFNNLITMTILLLKTCCVCYGRNAVQRGGEECEEREGRRGKEV